MNRVWINLIVAIVRRLLDPAVWASLSALVAHADASPLSGQAKRNWVLDTLDETPAPARAALQALAPWLVNLALEAVVAHRRVGTDA